VVEFSRPSGLPKVEQEISLRYRNHNVGLSKDAGSLHIALSPCAQLCNHEGWARNIRLFGFFRQRKAFDREYRDGS